MVGHIPLTGGPVKRFLSTQHYSSYYLYAEHANGGNLTLIDVTKTNQPAVLADVASCARWRFQQPDRGGRHRRAGQQSTGCFVSAAQAPQTIRIMDLSDPQNPKVAREFTGVTAMSKGRCGEG